MTGVLHRTHQGPVQFGPGERAVKDCRDHPARIRAAGNPPPSVYDIVLYMCIIRLYTCMYNNKKYVCIFNGYKLVL